MEMIQCLMRRSALASGCYEITEARMPRPSEKPAGTAKPHQSAPAGISRGGRSVSRHGKGFALPAQGGGGRQSVARAAQRGNGEQQGKEVVKSFDDLRKNTMGGALDTGGPFRTIRPMHGNPTHGPLKPPRAYVGTSPHLPDPFAIIEQPRR